MVIPCIEFPKVCLLSQNEIRKEVCIQFQMEHVNIMFVKSHMLSQALRVSRFKEQKNMPACY